MKKALALILSMILSLSLVACGEKAPEQDPASDTQQAETNEAWKPDKPVTILNPYSAGGSGDLEVKGLQAALERELGVNVVTEYLTGGGGSPGNESVYEADPDGYTLLYLNNPAATIMQLTDTVYYDVLNYTYLCNVSTEFRCLAVLADSELKTLDDLITRSKNGDSFTIAHSGAGSSGHLQTLMCEQAFGIDLDDVPFDGNSAAKSAFLGGHIDLWAIDASSCYKLVEDGTIRILAICAPERLERLPDIPTCKELGYDVTVSTSRGFVAPPDLPENIRTVLIDALYNAVNSSEMASFVETSGTNLDPLKGDEYKASAEELYHAVDAVKNLFE